MVKKKVEKTKDELVAVALDLAAARGWDAVSLRNIAQEAGVSLAVLHTHFEDKSDILAAFGRMIDREVLGNIARLDESESLRDRLFDVLMERYDVLNQYRAGLVSVLSALKCDPKQLVVGAPHLCSSMNQMMEAAGLYTQGLTGAIKLAGLTGIYIKVLKIWAQDDSPDLSKTMAALDKALGRAEQAANFFAL